ncbi:MAG: MFS transporter [Acidimicrobiia bacterium]|nr:MFS transporter [Acidimicrobiia bacterium]
MAGSRERFVTPQFVLVTLAGALYFVSLGTGIAVLPVFAKREFDAGALGVGVAVGAFAVGAVILRPFAGRIGDRTGRRLLVIGGATIVSVTTFAYIFATSLPALVGIRLVGGIGEAAFFVGAATMITDLSPVDRRGEALSYWSVAVYSGLAFGPKIGETVQQAWGFHAVWYVGAGLAGCAALLGLFTRETRPDVTPPEGGPLLHRAAILPGIMMFLGLIALAGYTAFLKLYGRTFGVDDVGDFFLLYGILVLAIRIFGATLPDRLGPLRGGTVALTGAGSAMVVIALFPSVVGLIVGTAIFAVGMSMMYTNLMTLALVGVDERERAAVVGTFSTFFDLSQGFGAFLVGAVVSVTSYEGGFFFGALASVAGLALLWSGADPRVREQHVAALSRDVIPEPEPGS